MGSEPILYYKTLNCLLNCFIEPHTFTRRCHLNFKHLVLFLLNQPQSALQTKLNGFFQQVTGAALESCQVTASAFCKARHKLDPAVFEALNQVVQAQLDAQGLRERWQPNFTQGLSCLRNSLVRLLLNPTRVLLSGLLELMASAWVPFAPAAPARENAGDVPPKAARGISPPAERS